ncbi:MAG: hypothetical protein V7609_3398 [Verrucomicrobiota bacterium]
MNTTTVVQTARLHLRPFSQDDLDDLTALMANPDFMRFATGVYSREQTAGFLERVGKRDSEGLPSQFAVRHIYSIQRIILVRRERERNPG